MNILITGASRGIGREIASIFAADKGDKVIALSRNREKLSALQKECLVRNPAAELIPLPYDLTGLSSDDGFIETNILPHFKHLDILINNAGYLHARPFEDTMGSEASRMASINFLAPAELIRKLIPLMGTTGSGHIINISSMGGVQGSVKFSGMAYYSASKAALATLTECLAEEYKERGIFFNCLAFGAVQTEMLTEAFPGYNAPITATEAAHFVVDFALTGHRYFNGKILPVSVTTP